MALWKGQLQTPLAFDLPLPALLSPSGDSWWHSKVLLSHPTEDKLRPRRSNRFSRASHTRFRLPPGFTFLRGVHACHVSTFSPNQAGEALNAPLFFNLIGRERERGRWTGLPSTRSRPKQPGLGQAKAKGWKRHASLPHSGTGTLGAITATSQGMR